MTITQFAFLIVEYLLSMSLIWHLYKKWTNNDISLEKFWYVVTHGTISTFLSGLIIGLVLSLIINLCGWTISFFILVLALMPISAYIGARITTEAEERDSQIFETKDQLPL